MNGKKLSVKQQLNLQASLWSLLLLGNIILSYVNDAIIKDYIKILFYIVFIILIAFFLKQKESADELVKIILGKANGKCIKIFMITGIVVFFLIDTSVYMTVETFMMISITFIAILRAVLFSYYDKKGI